MKMRKIVIEVGGLNPSRTTSKKYGFGSPIAKYKRESKDHLNTD